MTLLAVLPALLLTLTSVPPESAPWAEAGWTDREAAAHLLDRLAYGPRTGEVDRVVEIGLDRWIEEQLSGTIREPQQLQEAMSELDALSMSAERIAETYPPPGFLLTELREAGVISQEGEDRDPGERRRSRLAAERYLEEHGYRRPRELLEQLYGQKLYRAVYSENQLLEVLTDFWFNHFNVSLQDNQARPHLLSYERDVIRPGALGTFRELLGATARHPAMLLYLDNARSSAEEGRNNRASGRGRRRAGNRASTSSARSERAQGLNENYARELLELHTLGVEGGYEQSDVVEVARAFTGWTTLPPGRRDEMMQRLDRATGMGFVQEGLFVFAAHRHDAETKMVLGHRMPPRRGIEDGEEVLDILASHPATARHLAEKLAVRFVTDDPPASLVDRLASHFTTTRGDLRAVTRALVYSPEFWDPRYRTAKIKSPLELAASALRSLGAEIDDPLPTLEWIARMGQPLYAYQAPTGYPDRADFWVNTGALLSRMNFGLQLATGRIQGLELDLLLVNEGHEPESLDAALTIYLDRLLPERGHSDTVEQLARLVRDPTLREKIDQASQAKPVSLFPETGERRETMFPGPEPAPQRQVRSYEAPTELAQVVGVILGSPAYQRR